MSRPLRAALSLLLLGACAEDGFDDEDYVELTAELTFIGSDRHPGGPPPTGDNDLKRAWHEEQTAQLLEEYGISEEEYLEYSLRLHEDPARYSRVMRALAEEYERRNTELEDLEAPEEVKPPPGSFG